MTDQPSRHRHRHRRLADDIEDRHRSAAEDAIRRHGRDNLADDLALGGDGIAAGSRAFQDALRVAVAAPDRTAPLRRLALTVVVGVSGVVALLLVALVAWGAVPARADTITLVADDWCPYICDAKAEKPGFIFEIASASLEPHGHQVVHEVMPWARALVEVEAGRRSALAGAYYKKGRSYIYPAESVGLSVMGFVKKKSNPWRYQGLVDLDRAIIGVIKGYSYGPTLQPYINANAKNRKRIWMLHGANPLDGAFKRLSLGRLTAVITDVDTLLWTAASLGMAEKVEVAGLLPEREPLYIPFSPKLAKAKLYAEQLSDGIRKMRQDGRLAALRKRYGLGDW